MLFQMSEVDGIFHEILNFRADDIGLIVSVPGVHWQVQCIMYIYTYVYLYIYIFTTYIYIRIYNIYHVQYSYIVHMAI